MKKILIVLGIIGFAIWTGFVVRDIYKTFSFFKPFFALLNFSKYTYGWIALVYGFIDGYFFYHKREEKSKK